MAVSTRTRFEVFKRDGFTCQYCGRSRQDDAIKLHVDHVLPASKGGSDELDNLVTACQDCNLGKAAKLLDDRAPIPDVTDQLAELRKRRETLKEYAEENAMVRRDVEFVRDYWFTVWGVDEMPRSAVPWQSTLTSYVSSLGREAVCDAMEIAGRKFRYPSNSSACYLAGVLKGKLAEAEGRVVECRYCKGKIILDPGENTADIWWHIRCEPEEQEPEDRDESEEPWVFEPDEIDLEIEAWDELARAAGF